MLVTECIELLLYIVSYNTKKFARTIVFCISGFAISTSSLMFLFYSVLNINVIQGGPKTAHF